MKNARRIALLGSALTASTFLLSAPAQAGCTQSTTINLADTLNCGATPTTNTTLTTNSPNDRHYSITIPNSIFVNVTGPVTGYGLAVTTTTPGAFQLNVNNVTDNFYADRSLGYANPRTWRISATTTF